MPRASSGTGGIPPFPRVTMSPQDEIKLLKIVKDDDEFRYTFCTPSMAKPRQHEIAQRLCLEVMKSEVYFLGYAKKTGMIRQVDEAWEATDKWRTKVHNPVRTKLRAMTDSYKKAQEKYKKVLKPEQTKFADVPAHARGDLLVECPHFFRLKELCDPTEPLRVPRVRTPAPGPARPVRPRVELGNRPTRRAFPSPSPSEAPPSPTATPSPSPSPLPSPLPPPEPVVTRTFLALRPMSNTARPQDSSSFTRAPGAIARPNAVASSSRMAIKVERESSPSSSESSSDIEMLPAIAPRPDPIFKKTVDSSAFTRPIARTNAVASSSKVPIGIKREPSPTPSSSSSSSDVEHVSANASIASRHSSRQNTTASSSRKRIKVEPSPSISSSSSSTSESSSDHEMENDWVSEPEEGSASPEKRDWLNLRASRTPGGHGTTTASSTSTAEHIRSANDMPHGIGGSSGGSQGAAGTTHRGPKTSLPPVIISAQRQVTGGLGALAIREPKDESGEANSPAGSDDPDALLRSKKRSRKRIGLRLRAAVDDSPIPSITDQPAAITYFAGLRHSYTSAQTDVERGRLVYQAQFRLLCHAVVAIESLLVVPPFMQGCLIHFDPALHPYLHERVGQLIHFASLAGAAIAHNPKGLHIAMPGITRRILVSYKRVGFEQKRSYYKRGDSTFTIYHYSLLVFGKFCTDSLGRLNTLQFI